MYDYLKGSLVEVENDRITLDHNGIGFKIYTPRGRDCYYNSIGKEMVIYTRLLIKDDEMFLYGFDSSEERQLFNVILNISGFGPRTVLSILGVLTASQLYIAVLEEDINLICQAPGVGRKAAQRLILELKEKLPSMMPADDLIGTNAKIKSYSVAEDVTEALCSLGYSRNEAMRVVNKVLNKDKQLAHEELLKIALKAIAAE